VLGLGLVSEDPELGLEWVVPGSGLALEGHAPVQGLAQVPSQGLEPCP
jgi:hypothetical protein